MRLIEPTDWSAAIFEFPDRTCFAHSVRNAHSFQTLMCVQERNCANGSVHNV
uniref:Uncharacterized protein n=1 Tax=Anguilla anguilla TaxID=7936 RepID=A0A0E9W8B7_ANGAN